MTFWLKTAIFLFVLGSFHIFKEAIMPSFPEFMTLMALRAITWYARMLRFVGFNESVAMKLAARHVVNIVQIVVKYRVSVMYSATRKLYWILIRDEVGFYKGTISFNMLYFFPVGLVVGGGWGMLATLIMIEQSWFPFDLAFTMPFVGVVIAAICCINLPPVNWSALQESPVTPPSPPNPPPDDGGGEPLPNMGVGGIEEPLEEPVREAA